MNASIGLVFLLLLTIAAATTAPAVARDDNEPMATADDQSDIVAESATGATVVGTIQDGPRAFPVWAQKYSAPVSESVPWEHLPVYQILTNNQEGPLFDPQTNFLTFTLWPRELGDSDLQGIKDYYARRGESTESIKPREMHERPLIGYSVTLTHGDKSITLVEKNTPPDGAGWSGPIPVDVEITDEALREAIINRPEAVQINLQMRYPARQWRVQQVNIHLLQKAASEAWESVAGDANIALLNREVAAELRAQLRNKLIVTVENMAVDSSTTNMLLDRAMKLIDSFSTGLDESAGVPIDELAELIDAGAVIGIVQLQDAAAPKFTRDMKTAFESRENYRKFFDKQWQKLSSSASESATFNDFWMKISASGGADCLIFETNVAVNTEWKQTMRQFWQHTQNNEDTGHIKNDLMHESFEKWTGEVYQESTEPKTLNLNIARKQELFKLVSASFQIADAVGQIIESRGFGYTLNEVYAPPLAERVAKLEAMQSGIRVLSASIFNPSDSEGDHWNTGGGSHRPMPVDNDISFDLQTPATAMLTATGIARVIGSKKIPEPKATDEWGSASLHLGFFDPGQPHPTKKERLGKACYYRHYTKDTGWNDNGGDFPFSLTSMAELAPGHHEIAFGSVHHEDGNWQLHNVKVQVLILPH